MSINLTSSSIISNYNNTTISSNRFDNLNINYDLVVSDTGHTTIKKLVLVDSLDGSKWDVMVYDGKLMIEPHGDLSDKRNYRINKVLK